MSKDMNTLFQTFCDENSITYVGNDKVKGHWKVQIVAKCGHEKTLFWSRLNKLNGVIACSECYVAPPRVSDTFTMITQFCTENDITYVRHEKIGEYWSVTIIAKCGHEKQILWVNLKLLSGVNECSTCCSRAPLTYDKCVSIFEEEGCHLKTTKEEFEKTVRSTMSYFEYYARCGHLISTTRFSHFKEGQGRKCKECTATDTSTKYIARTTNDKMRCQQIELEGYEVFVKTTENKFEIMRSGEGCLADIIIRPTNSKDDLWLPIQLKATREKDSHSRYMFTLNNDYSDIVVCCIAISEERFWLLDDEDIPKISCIGISKKNTTTVSKYDKFECPKSDVSTKLMEMFERVKLLDKKTALTPISDSCRKELKYRLLREERMPFINFEYPTIQTSVYDFTVNGIKVQEKVLIVDPKYQSLTANFSKAGGKGKQKIPYEEGDNDFYWFHYQDTLMFYMIPEHVLIENGRIRTETQKGAIKMLVYPQCTVEEARDKKYKTCELNNYLYSYDSPEDMAKIRTIFGIADVPEDKDKI